MRKTFRTNGPGKRPWAIDAGCVASLPTTGSLLIALVLSVTATSDTARAAEIIVNDNCSLAEAITAANSDSSTGGCPAGAGADRIVLPQNEIITLLAPAIGITGLPYIQSEITIEGNGTTIQRSDEPATPHFRIFDVFANGTLRLEDLTVRNGSAFKALGGGIYVSGNATLSNVILWENTAINDGNGGTGGGMWIRNTATVVMEDCIVRNNVALFAGGVENRGNLTVRNCKFIGNRAESDNSGASGGGLYNFFGATLAIRDSEFIDNQAKGSGGGLLNTATATVTSSTFVNNSASIGGAIWNQDELTLVNSTLAENHADNTGGGIYGSANVSTTLLNSTIAFNSSGSTGAGLGGLSSANTYTLGNTILYNPEGEDCFPTAALTDLGGNWFGDSSCDGDGDGDPLLGSLNELPGEDGLTATLNLLPASCAIDSGINELCADSRVGGVDQRGVIRPATRVNDGLRCDIGAFEFELGLKQFFPVTGSLSGLTGLLQLGLALDGLSAATLPFDANGDISFGQLPRDSAFEIIVSSQPSGQECTVTMGAGVVPCGGLSTIAVACTDLGPVILDDGFEPPLN